MRGRRVTSFPTRHHVVVVVVVVVVVAKCYDCLSVVNDEDVNVNVTQ
jgi:hypothetical protein